MHLIDCLLLLMAGLLALSHGQLTFGHDGDSCTSSSQQQILETDEGSPSLKITPANADFAFRFYHLIASETPGKNIFFSPLSISAAYAMLSLGAGSYSRTQILEGLGFNLTELSESDIHRGFQHLLHTLNHPCNWLETRMGSALFLSHSLKFLEKFLNDTRTFYEAKLFHTNFYDTLGTMKLINYHVKKETQGKIVNLVGELNRDVMMVLVNYIYFKGRWKKPFISSRTITRNFYVDENTTVRVPMMLQDQEDHWYLRDQHLPCLVLRMDYKENATAFFILPNQGKMREIEEVLTPEMLMRWNNLLHKRIFYKKLRLYFPKFSISDSYVLNQILPRLGFTDLFSQWADLSGISKQRKLQLPTSFHKATLHVDEAGTEAAAATSFGFTFLSAQISDHVLHFNRPFLVVLFSTNTQNILFLGKVVDPTRP
ncbi:kallistatin [Saimiri boliviensis]|uniref:Serpin family A member 4 n=1 Tax=Saimiri boliviensis boliviensis TaxID=39432 RepID=A0A2K6U0U3_SAIBB|nr:kallistatin [Saimiri boliviensis boliviensis]XP_039324595.1 kallistatin [Saimiri boliviensis boliviensis]